MNCRVIFTDTAEADLRDIAFYIGNSEPIRMGTSLSYEQSTIQAIAQELMQQADKRVALKDALKYETSTREVTKEEVESGGLVHNAVVYNLANMYSGYDWSNPLLEPIKVLSRSNNKAFNGRLDEILWRGLFQ